jgi:hypothetical protein
VWLFGEDLHEGVLFAQVLSMDEMIEKTRRARRC